MRRPIEIPDLNLEERWQESLHDKTFQELGLRLPKAYRPLPRWYHRDDFKKSRIKNEFCRLSFLKKYLSFRPLLSTYRESELKVRAKLAIVSHIFSDGLGDWAATIATADIIQNALPQIEIEIFYTHDRPVPQSTKYSSYYAETFLPKWHKKLDECDLILTIPTYVKLEKEKIIRIGEYGCIESGCYHPQSKNWSMGLNPLELGVMIPEKIKTPIESQEIRKWLKNENLIFLAYLATHFSGRVYLTALLTALKDCNKDIDLVIPSPYWWLHWIQEKDVPSFLGVKAIELHWKEAVHRVTFREEGKTVRILAPQYLSREDLILLCSFSGEFVGVRGNQSWSEAVLAKKVFFYDTRLNNRYFMKDLVALAKSRFCHPISIRYIQLMEEASIANLSEFEEKGEWVEETYFQKTRGWKEIGEEIGSILFTDELKKDFSLLSEILHEEHSFNQVLPLMIKRALIHQSDPELKESEETFWDLYAEGEIPFSLLIKQRRMCYDKSWIRG